MIIDIIVIVLLLLGAFSGYKKGLVGILVSFIGMIIAIVLAFGLQIPVANYLNDNTIIGKSINQTITKGITQTINNKDIDKDENQDKKIDFYDGIIEKITNEDQIASVSNNIVLFILKGISFVLIFIIVIIIFYIIQMVLNLVFNLPILGTVNKIGGVITGILKSLVGIWILLAIISFLSPIQMLNSIVGAINTSFVTNFLYSHNLFVALIMSTIKIN